MLPNNIKIYFSILLVAILFILIKPTYSLATCFIWGGHNTDTLSVFHIKFFNKKICENNNKLDNLHCKVYDEFGKHLSKEKYTFTIFKYVKEANGERIFYRCDRPYPKNAIIMLTLTINGRQLNKYVKIVLRNNYEEELEEINNEEFEKFIRINKIIKENLSPSRVPQKQHKHEIESNIQLNITNSKSIPKTLKYVEANKSEKQSSISYSSQDSHINLSPLPKMPPQSTSPSQYIPTASEMIELIIKEMRSDYIKIGDIKMEFVPIREGAGEEKHYIGLSRTDMRIPELAQYNLLQISSAKSGPAEIELVNSYLIQRNEVSNAQYLPFAKEMWRNKQLIGILPKSIQKYIISNKPMPIDLAKKPVTEVSYQQAEQYSHWLENKLNENNKMIKWSIRLPFEIEWEIAARHGKSSYTFTSKNKTLFFDYVTKLSDLMEAGSNKYDVTWNSIRDMSANAREWTASIFNEELISILKLAADINDTPTWDPCQPYANNWSFNPNKMNKKSYLMCVRGGANSEVPYLMLVSLRRMMEWSSTDPEVGFRLVIAPKK